MRRFLHDLLDCCGAMLHLSEQYIYIYEKESERE